jgi:hypothetical protein
MQAYMLSAAVSDDAAGGTARRNKATNANAINAADVTARRITAAGANAIIGAYVAEAAAQNCCNPKPNLCG